MNVQEIKNANFHWVDVVDPSREELHTIAKSYDLPYELVLDCLEHGHLPKYEETEKFQFFILRAFDPEAGAKSDSVTDLTRKLAVFLYDGFVFTFHRKQQPYVKAIFDKWTAKSANIASKDSVRIVSELFVGAAKTFESGVNEAYQTFYEFEQNVFNQDRKLRLSQSYLLKRRTAIMKRILRMNWSTLSEGMDENNTEASIFFNNARDYIDKLIFQLDEIHEGVTSLLNLQVTLASQKTNQASQRTNEVMRILTILSVFIMPMNLIASIYGMNFEHMPELKWVAGYPMALILMVIVGISVVYWFRSKGWLSGL